MNLASAIAVSTVWARFSAPSGLRFGARREGDLTRPASIAASAIVTFFVLPIASSIIFSLVPALRDNAAWFDLGTAQQPLFEASAGLDLTGEQYGQLATTALIWIVLPFVLGWFRVMRAELK